MSKDIGQNKFLVCSNCGYLITVSDDEEAISTVRKVYGEKHDFVLRDRNSLAEYPLFFPFDGGG